MSCYILLFLIRLFNFFRMITFFQQISFIFQIFIFLFFPFCLNIPMILIWFYTFTSLHLNRSQIYYHTLCLFNNWRTHNLHVWFLILLFTRRTYFFWLELLLEFNFHILIFNIWSTLLGFFIFTSRFFYIFLLHNNIFYLYLSCFFIILLNIL